jgi:protein-L-isoaspartate(D-aspartate) O-methyltransferase
MNSTATSAASGRDTFAAARLNMVENQIRTNRVTDIDLLAVLAKAPREIFVPGSLAPVAYVDSSLRVAPGRVLTEPLDLARLLQEAAIAPGDRVLVIGPATGYSVAVVAQLAAKVTGIESDPGLAATARANLARLGLANAVIEVGPMTEGFSAGAPYDVILIDGMVADLPAPIVEQLAERGRLVTLLAGEGRCAAGMLYRKLGGSVSGRVLFDCAGSFLPGFAPAMGFAF